MNTKAKVHMYLYKADDTVPAWDGKQLTRLRTFIATNGLTGTLRIKAHNLASGEREEISVKLSPERSPLFCCYAWEISRTSTESLRLTRDRA